MASSNSTEPNGFASAKALKASADELAALGAPFALPDGSRVRIRPWRPSDRQLLVSGFYRLSPTSSYRRFLSASPVLTTKMEHDLTDIDHGDHEAIVALDERGSQGVGIARYVRSDERRNVAEVALAVIDDWQGRGLGTLLLDVISARARQQGIKTFSALMLAENREMRALLDRLGPVRIIDEDRGTVEVEVAIPAVAVLPTLRKVLPIERK
jgi:GNAT superfamily N-acetyltransferase